MISIVTWFEKDGDNFVDSLQVEGVTLPKLQEVFGVDPGNPMYDAYPIETEDQVKFVEEQLQQSLNLELYQYFVEYSN
jgi:hypothetical protein